MDGDLICTYSLVFSSSEEFEMLVSCILHGGNDLFWIVG
jgi:hypothetical protein